MTKPEPEPKRRKTQRLRLRVPVLVRSQSSNEGVFEERTYAVDVSANGGLLLLRNSVIKGQWLKLRHNEEGREELLCMAVRQEPAANGEVRVAVEFCEARPTFWHVAFPPEDWLSQPEPETSDAPGRVSLAGRTYLQDEIRLVITDHWTLLKSLYRQDARLSFGRGELRSVILLYCGPEAGYSFTMIGSPLESFRYELANLNAFEPLRPLVRHIMRFTDPKSGRIEGLFCRVSDPERQGVTLP